MCPSSCPRTNKTSENDQTDINTTSRSQPLLPTTRKVDEAGQTRRTLPIFQTFFNIENEEGSTFGKHEPLLPPLWSSVSSPSERPRIFHISSWKKLGEKSGVTGWIEAKKTTPMKKMFHGDRCKSASTPSLLWRYVRYVWKGRLDHPFPSNHGMAHRVYDTYEAVRVSREDTAFDFRLVIVKEGVR